MKKWVLKAIVQKIISWLPASQKINFLFQKYITGGVHLSDRYFRDKLTHAIDHIRYFKMHNKTGGFRVLELGSGWYPVVPVALFLTGAERVISIDINPLMTREGICRTMAKFIAWNKEGKLKNLEPYLLPERFDQLVKILNQDLPEKDLLERLHLQLEVKDARHTGFEREAFDLVCSNNTFEHIYPNVLEDILLEFQRVLKEGGIMSHFIDMSDHFAHLDSSITVYNFLTFSRKQWQRIDNSVQPQNRWRLKDYEALYHRLGIRIVDKHLRPGSVEQVNALPVHREFAAYALEELAVSHVHLVSSK